MKTLLLIVAAFVFLRAELGTAERGRESEKTVTTDQPTQVEVVTSKGTFNV